MSDQFVLVLNAGSSSLKYQVLRMGDGERLVGRRLEEVPRGGFDAALEQVHRDISDASLVEHLTAVGHRVVHGGDRHTAPELIDDALEASVEELSHLAPLHNPPAVAAIRSARMMYPGLPQVAVFDTAFFTGLPAVAATYAVERRVADAAGIRRFGMHGISHEYVAARTAETLGRRITEIDQIVLHLGNGASAAAIRRGFPVETSMGFTPLEGLMMGTRGGDMDPGILLHLLRHGGYDPDGLDELLHRRSGLKGLSGVSDFRELLDAVGSGGTDARLAYEVYGHRIRKYVGAYLAVLGGAHALTFTGGVGENVAQLREDCLAGLDALGIEIDPGRNRTPGKGARLISTDASRVAVLVVPTDEEAAIADKVLALLDGRAT